MKRFLSLSVACLMLLSLTSAALAQGGTSHVRVVHASPDAPALDVLVDDAVAFEGTSFRDITDYAELKPGRYDLKVVPGGKAEPIVIEVNPSLISGVDYTVVAVGNLADVEPLILMDDNRAPSDGEAHMRFVHASPDAPAVDVAVKGGPVLFRDIAFKGVGGYRPVGAGTYDLEVRAAGTDTVMLEVPGVVIEAGAVYTIFAMGLASGEPAIEVIPSVDSRSAPTEELVSTSRAGAPAAVEETPPTPEAEAPAAAEEGPVAPETVTPAPEVGAVAGPVSEAEAAPPAETTETLERLPETGATSSSRPVMVLFALGVVLLGLGFVGGRLAPWRLL